MPFTPFQLAMIVVVPGATELASPLLPIVATFTFGDVQLTSAVRFCVEPSLKLPVAVKRCEVPSGMLGLAGVIVIESRVALVTVSVAIPTCPANSAVIVAVPAAFPVARPLFPPLSFTVATDAGDDVHNADCVRSCVLPSANDPIARNWVEVCTATLAVEGVISKDASADDSTTTVIDPETDPC